jgi:hypothetical protein
LPSTTDQRESLATAEIDPLHDADQGFFIERTHAGDVGQATSPLRLHANRCQILDPHRLFDMTTQAGDRFIVETL